MGCRVWVGMVRSHVAGGGVEFELGTTNVLDGRILVLGDGSCLSNDP